MQGGCTIVSPPDPAPAEIEISPPLPPVLLVPSPAERVSPGA
jgi:hypothetical protein